MNQSHSIGKLRLLNLREQTEAKGEQLAAERSRFHRLAQEDQAPRVVSSFNLFQTPEEIADLMVETAQPKGRILEPSAGLGRLYQAIRKATSDHITLVEISTDCCSELYRTIEPDGNCSLFNRDFMAWNGGLFNTIVMNPPFKMGTDIKHIDRALSMLAPGGRLVSLCYWGVKQRKRFADCEVCVLPSGSFKSEGTKADIAMVTINL